MRLLAAFLLLAAACSSQDYQDTAQPCGPSGACPSGFSCNASDDRCYQDGALTMGPVVTILSPGTGLTMGSHVTVTFSSREATATFECKLDAGSYAPCTSPMVFSGLADGAHTCLVRATDDHGDIGEDAQVAWIVDTTAPTVTIAAKPTDPLTNNKPTFTFAVSDGTPSCALDSEAAHACTSATTQVYTTAIPDGTHHLVVSSTDAAGNFGSDSVTFVIDTNTAVPVLRYTFDDVYTSSGTTAGYDVIGNGTTFVAGKFGQALKVNAPTTYATISGIRGVLGGESANYTISYWYSTTSSATNRLTDFYSSTGGISTYLTNGTGVGNCVATTTSPYLDFGACGLGTAPASDGTWHHLLMRYAATGTGAGQGGNVELYIDDVLVHTSLNDADNNPVFNATINDTFSLGLTFDTADYAIDELRVYNQVFSDADQCTKIIGGTWNGTSCAMP